MRQVIFDPRIQFVSFPLLKVLTDFRKVNELKSVAVR